MIIVSCFLSFEFILVKYGSVANKSVQTFLNSLKSTCFIGHTTWL